MDINKVKDYAESVLKADLTGHGFDHAVRVAHLAEKIIDEDQLIVDQDVVLAAAYLHDTIDDKVIIDTENTKREIETLLIKAGATSDQLQKIVYTIENLSYSKELLQKSTISFLEGQIVKDADRLEAMGALGILRTSYYGGSHKHPLHDPELKPKNFASHADYRKGTTVINHFYEKLLLLPEKMHTEFAKKEALRRKVFMEEFLEEFYQEWEV